MSQSIVNRSILDQQVQTWQQLGKRYAVEVIGYVYGQDGKSVYPIRKAVCYDDNVVILEKMLHDTDDCIVSCVYPLGSEPKDWQIEEKIGEENESQDASGSESFYIQKLMGEAHLLWRKNENWSYGDFLNNLDYCHRAAVVVGNLNYQVKNGGFKLWIDSSHYKHDYDVLVSVLKDFINDGNDIGQYVLSILYEVHDVEQDLSLTDKWYNGYVDEDELEQRFGLDIGWEPSVIVDEIINTVYTVCTDYGLEGADADEVVSIIRDPVYVHLEGIYRRKIDRKIAQVQKDIKQRLCVLNEQYLAISEEFLKTFEKWLMECCCEKNGQVS